MKSTADPALGAETKHAVHDFWNQSSCGEDLYLSALDVTGFDAHMRKRYELEPYIADFAKFSSSRGKHVLEIGVGIGADHQQFAQAGAHLTGIDLTERAVLRTTERFRLNNLTSDLRVGDAEHLPFFNNAFDVVYSWGVIHHSPNTLAAVREIERVLRVGGVARVMIYNYWSIIGLMLWLRYALLRGRPWQGLTQMYCEHLESPGTKAYTPSEAREMFSIFKSCTVNTVMTHGDLLEGHAGQRHQGILLSLARKVWPRWLIRRLAPRAGLFMLIEAYK
jgi:SAM-dependent methyltransferase